MSAFARDSFCGSGLGGGHGGSAGLAFRVLISANAEWRVVKPLFAREAIQTSPYGDYFFAKARA
jgi:hypothetical protein